MAGREINPNLLRDHLANERTFLAWMRTAITVIALGFVVAKFGILLREIGGQRIHPLTVRVGAVVGVALVIGGVLMIFFATLRFLRIRDDIDHSVIRYDVRLDVALAAVATVIASVLAVYLVITS